MSLFDRASLSIEVALERLAREGAIGDEMLRDKRWTLERPKRLEHGDLATNVAMVLGKRAGMAPRAFAEKVIAALANDPNGVVRTAEIAGPGFVNLRLYPAVFHAELEA